MKKTSLALLSVQALLSVSVFAGEGGSSIGNGGDAVVCRDKNGKRISARLLDFYEAETSYKTPVIEALGGDEISHEEKINILLKRIEKFDPWRASRYAERLASFESESKRLKNVKLTDVPDSNHTSYPEHCEVEQFVVQENPAYPDLPRYTINEDIWAVSDTSTQAGIKLHEIVYADALEQGAKDSRMVRHYVAMMASEEVQDLEQYERLTIKTLTGPTLPYLILGGEAVCRISYGLKYPWVFPSGGLGVGFCMEKAVRARNPYIEPFAGLLDGYNWDADRNRETAIEINRQGEIKTLRVHQLWIKAGPGEQRLEIIDHNPKKKRKKTIVNRYKYINLRFNEAGYITQIDFNGDVFIRYQKGTKLNGDQKYSRYIRLGRDHKILVSENGHYSIE